MILRKTVRARWIAALRSGDYKQGRQRLRTVKGEEESFCCLGVLCELGVTSGVPIQVRSKYDNIIGDNTWSYDGSDTQLGPTVRQWAGLSDWIGPDKVNIANLIDWNDGGKTFSEIADLLESDPDRERDVD